MPPKAASVVAKKTTKVAAPAPVAKTTKKAAPVVETMVDEPTPKAATKTTTTKTATLPAPSPTTTSTTKKTTTAQSVPSGNAFARAIHQPSVRKAVKALRSFLTGESSASKKLIENEGGYFELQINLKKAQIQSKSHSIPLIHSIYKRPGVSICLFTKDPQDEWEEFLQNNPVSNLTTIISLKKLATDFKPYEHRRLLKRQHDMFLVDESIVPMMKQLLGQDFFGSNKLPIKVNLSRKFKVQIQKQRDSTHFTIPRGQTFTIRVGHGDLSDDEIIENIANIMPQLQEVLPKGIASILLKTEFSASLPLYVNLATKEDFVATVQETQKKLEKTVQIRQTTLANQAKKYKLTTPVFQKVKAAALRCQMPVAKYLKIAQQRGTNLGSDVQLPPPKEDIKAVVTEASKIAKAAKAVTATATAKAPTTAKKEAAVQEETQPKAATKRKTAPKADINDAPEPSVKKPVKKARK